MHSLPPGRKLVMSLSGTEMTDWKWAIASASCITLGLGIFLGRVTAPGFRKPLAKKSTPKKLTTGKAKKKAKKKK